MKIHGNKIITHTVIKHDPKSDKAKNLKNWFEKCGNDQIKSIISNMALDGLQN